MEIKMDDITLAEEARNDPEYAYKKRYRQTCVEVYAQNCLIE